MAITDGPLERLWADWIEQVLIPTFGVEGIGKIAEQRAIFFAGAWAMNELHETNNDEIVKAAKDELVVFHMELAKKTSFG